MNDFTATLTLVLMSAVATGLMGCGDNSTKPVASSHTTVTAGPPATVETGRDHAHPIKGLHGGSLIELGSEEYHAELIHDDASSSVTVYLLDSAAKQAVAIEAKDVKVNLSHEGQAEQFALVASPQESDTDGKASRFISQGAEVCEELCHKDAQGQLVVVINGKQFRGDIEHEHDH